MHNYKKVEKIQGIKTNVEGVDAWLNVFTEKEMLTIYLGMIHCKDYADMMLKNDFSAFKSLTRVEKEDLKETRKIIELSESVIGKIKMTFDTIGLKIDGFE
jgi:hypothetical protein